MQAKFLVLISASLLIGLCLYAWLLFSPPLPQSPEELPIQTTQKVEVKPEMSPVVLAQEIKKLLPPPDSRPTVSHVPLPENVKAIYMSACVAGTPSFRERLISLIETTELNSVMIDIKDFSGSISFAPTTTSAWYPAWQNADCGARDMKDFIAALHDKNIFVIGRITVFQDPFYAPAYPGQAVQKNNGTIWRDHKGLAFVDVASQTYWKHIVDLSVLSYNLGFDELNFDYIRYPSDGNMGDIYFPQSAVSQYGFNKPANLEAFFSFLHKELTDPANFANIRHQNTGREESIPWTSADLFGMTTSNYDGLSIGQLQERAAPYFDFIAPMVYPSHYTYGFLGGRNPNEYPYQVVYKAMSDGVARMTAGTTLVDGFAHERIGTTTPAIYAKTPYGPDKFRTWIQDFDYGGIYDVNDVRAQIQASYDAGVNSWMIWAPSNIYTRGALLSAPGIDN